jgi:hypothetical protein
MESPEQRHFTAIVKVWLVWLYDKTLWLVWLYDKTLWLVWLYDKTLWLVWLYDKTFVFVITICLLHFESYT